MIEIFLLTTILAILLLHRINKSEELGVLIESIIEKIIFVIAVSFILFSLVIVAIGITEQDEKINDNRNEFCENWNYHNSNYYCLKDNTAKPFICNKTDCYYLEK